MPRRPVSPTLVGRAMELAALGEALDRAVAGEPVHQLIAGEAGVGKSRLVAELSAAAAGRGMRVLAGGCVNIGDGGVPYGPIVEAFRTLFQELDAAAMEQVLGASTPDLARLVPSLSPDAASALNVRSESLQVRLLDAVLSVLQRLAHDAPVLFIIEDLHWADPATRETIGFLLRQLRTDRVVLVLTLRADELHRRHPLLPWLAELDRSDRVDRHDLDRLDAAGTRELLAAILGEAPPAAVVDQIQRRSDGNPFFIEELLMAGDSGAPARLPPTLRELLLTRIVALPEPAQSVIGVAAVAGRRVDHDLLARVAGMDEPELMLGLRSAVEAHVFVTGDDPRGAGSDYAFRHALLQEVAYDDLLPGERQRLHRAFAEALADDAVGRGAAAAGRWAELAHHWSAARDDRRAFEALIRAGDAAAMTYAFVDAQRHDERALELWSTIDDAEALAGMDRAGLLDRAASGAWLSGNSHRSVALRREALAALGPDADLIRHGTMLERLGRSLWNNGESLAALEAHESAVALMPAHPPTAELARVLAGYGQVLMLLDRWRESREICDQAIAMARVTGARQAEGHALNTRGLDLAAEGSCSEAIINLEDALEIAREVADADDIGRAYVNLGEARLYCGDVRGSADISREGIIAAEAVGVTRIYGRFIREHGIAAAFELGEWDEASRLAREAFGDDARARQQIRYGLSRWVSLLVATGDPQANERLEQLRGMLVGFPVETQFNVPYHVAAAEWRLWQGDPATALETIDQGLRETDGRESHWHRPRLFRVGMWAAADLADIARARRDADGVAAALAVGAQLWDGFQRVAKDLRSRRLLADPGVEPAMVQAERSRLLDAPSTAVWHDAARRCGAASNPYLRAYCQWRESEAILGEGTRADAVQVLGEAHQIGLALGARPLVTAIEGLAARARLDLADGASVPPEPASVAEDPFRLTRRERDVLPLIVKGRTNRQIAAELFISENTAGVHVSNILGKLGAATRAEAAGIAATLGLGGDAG